MRASADGYTLLLQNSTMVVNPAVAGKLNYDPEKDLSPIMLLGLTPIALFAHPSANIRNLRDLIDASKTNPSALSYGSCGIGTPQHFVMELVKLKSGVGVSTATRYELMPEVLTFEEQGLKALDFSIWYALMGPAGMPPELVGKIQADAQKVLDDAEVRARLSAVGVEALKGTGAALAKLIREDLQRYKLLAKSANIKAE